MNKEQAGELVFVADCALLLLASMWSWMTPYAWQLDSIIVFGLGWALSALYESYLKRTQ